MQPEPVIPLFPFARLWWTLVCCARRRPAAVIAVLVAVAMIAGTGVVATHAPARGCQWRVVAGPGREHLVCVSAREAGHGA
jgi:hypothetical protein